ncbi:MAG: GAF domain-containing protein, partial [Candidatus Rokubacteria bacterium]|nr:GAF domain-containing protein [Candidatus Rokubacteria bacterium]
CPDQLADPDLRLPGWAVDRIQREGYRSGTAAPLMVQGEVLGTLFLGDASGRALPERGLRVLAAFADLAALAIHTAELGGRLGERLERLRALTRLNELLVSSLDADEILGEIARAAAELMRAPLVAFWDADEAARTLTVRAVAGELAAEPYPLRQLRYGEGGVGWVAEHRAPLEVGDLPGDERARGREWFRARGLTAGLAVPVIHENTLLGVLALLGRERFRFDADDRSLLQSFAAQAAASLRNARLLGEAQAQRRRLETLVTVAQRLTRGLDLQTVLGSVAEVAAAVFEGEAGFRLLEGADLVMAGATPGARRSMVTERMPLGEPVSGLVAATGEPMVIGDIAADPRLPPERRARVAEEGNAALMCVPIRVGARVLGTLNIYRERPHIFDQDALALAMALAGQVGVAIDNARLFDESERRRREAERLGEVGRLLAETLDAALVGQRIADSARELLAAQAATVYRLEPGAENLVGLARSGEAALAIPRDVVLPKGIGVAGLAVRLARPVSTSDVLADPQVELTADLRAGIVQGSYRSVLGLPLAIEGRVIGALAIGDRSGRAYSASDVQLAQALADQAALALESARQYEEAERHRREAEILADLVADINASRDLDDMLLRVGAGARDLCGSDLAGVALREPASDAVVFSHWPGARLDYGRIRVEPGKGVGGMVLATGRPFRTDCYAEDSRITQDYREIAAAEGIVAAMAVPITGQGRVEGLLYVHNRSPRPFTGRDEAILLRLADHAARAIGNARLNEELRTRQGQLEALLEASRELSRIQPVKSLLRRITELCGRLLDSASVGIRLVEGDDLVMGEGTAEARQVMVTPRLKVGQSLSGIVAATREPLVVDDMGSDPRVEPVHREAAVRFGYARWLGVPLKAGERVLGVLSVRRAGNRSFTDEDLAVATAFASQAAAALENARLYREAQEAYASLAATQAQLGQSQKMEAVGQLAGGIAHDFNNLLTVVLGRSELALARLRENDPLRRDLGLIQSTSQRAANLVRQLLAFSRKQVLRPEVLDLGAVVAELEGMLRRLIGEDIDLVTAAGADLGRVKADPSQIEQVIVNLVVNARDAMPGGGRITVETANVDLDGASAATHQGLRPGAYVRLAVQDTGQGMDAETQAHIFEPFFTTKEVGKGTGLGLATVYGIVKQSEGYILVESVPDLGTTFTIYLPRVEEDAAPVPASPAPAVLPRGTETILLVEDDPELRALALDILRGSGYTVLEARQGNEALLVLERHAGPIHLLVTDVVMPQMGGRALAERLASLRPEMKVLYMSGYSEAAIAQHGVLDPGTAFMAKPFTADEVTRKIREVLDAP